MFHIVAHLKLFVNLKSSEINYLYSFKEIPRVLAPAERKN